MGKRLRPFTLFLCIGIVLFMVFGWRILQNRAELVLDGKRETPHQFEGVITLWDYPRPILGQGGNYGWIRERIREFEKANPGVFIELRPLDWEEGRIQLDFAVSYGTYPDIAPIGGCFDYADGGVLEPLDELFFPDRQDEYMEYAIEAVSHRGRLWGVPLYAAAPVMILNLESFEAAKVTPPTDGRWTYDQFVSALQRLTLDNDSGGKPGQYGFGSYIQNGYYNLWGILLSDGWDVYDPVTGTYTVDTPQAVSGLDKLVRLAGEYGVASQDMAVCSSAMAWREFAAQKKVAVYPENAWALEQLKILQSEGRGFEFGTAAYPSGSRGIPVTVGDVAAYGLFKQSDEARKRVCIEFIRHVACSIDREEILDKGLLPVLRGHGQDKGETVDTDGIIIIPKMQNWSHVEDILNTHIRQALLGVETSAQALQAAQREIDMLYSDH